MKAIICDLISRQAAPIINPFVPICSRTDRQWDALLKFWEAQGQVSGSTADLDRDCVAGDANALYRRAQVSSVAHDLAVAARTATPFGGTEYECTYAHIKRAAAAGHRIAQGRAARLLAEEHAEGFGDDTLLATVRAYGRRYQRKTGKAAFEGAGPLARVHALPEVLRDYFRGVRTVRRRVETICDDHERIRRQRRAQRLGFGQAVPAGYAADGKPLPAPAGSGSGSDGSDSESDTSVSSDLSGS